MEQNSLFQRLATEKFIPPSAPFHEAVGCDEPSKTKDLNIQNTYTIDKEVSVKEHIQNWRDQCVAVGRKLDPSYSSLRHLKPHQLTYQDWNIYVYKSTDKKCTLGCIAWKSTAENLIQLELYNCATVLKADEVLVLGRSGKAGNIDTAGYFGEGAKVEVNRLLFCEASVTYRTGSMLWDFDYNERQILQAHITQLGSEYFIPNTTISIENCPKSAFDPEDYLYIHIPTTVIGSRTDPFGKQFGGIELLLDETYYGKIYLHGILIMNIGKVKANDTIRENIEQSPMKFGVNYCGLNMLGALKVGRDRNELHLEHLLIRLPYLFIDNTPSDVALLSKHLYDTLNSFKEKSYNLSQNSWKYAYAFKESKLVFTAQSGYYYAEVLRNTATVKPYFVSSFLLEEFIRRHTEKAIPREEQYSTYHTDAAASLEAKKRMEAEFFGLEYVSVAPLLYDWLKLSDSFPTIESVWSRNSKRILSLPEYIFDEIQPTYPVQTILHFPNDACKEFACVLRQQINMFFDDKALGNRVRMKDFQSVSPVNIRRMMKVTWKPEETVSSESSSTPNALSTSTPSSKYRPSTTTNNTGTIDYYILDWALLNIDRVHEELKQSDKSFKCTELNCGCIQNLLIDDILRTFPEKDQKDYETKFRRRYINSLPINSRLQLIAEQRKEYELRYQQELAHKKRIAEEQEAAAAKAKAEAEEKRKQELEELKQKAIEETKKKEKRGPKPANIKVEEIKKGGNKSSLNEQKKSQKENFKPSEAPLPPPPPSPSSITSVETPQNVIPPSPPAPPTNAPVVNEKENEAVQPNTANLLPPTPPLSQPTPNPTNKATPTSASRTKQGQPAVSNHHSSSISKSSKLSSNNNHEGKYSTSCMDTTELKENALETAQRATSLDQTKSFHYANQGGNEQDSTEQQDDEDTSMNGNYEFAESVVGLEDDQKLRVFIHQESMSTLLHQPQERAKMLDNEHLYCFGTMIALLAKYVFHYPIERCHIVIANTDTLGFNRGKGNIFFNLLPIKGYFQIKTPVELLDYLYALFCHEYTHNMVNNHNTSFASVLHSVFVGHMKDFRVLVSTVKQACIPSFAVHGNHPDTVHMSQFQALFTSIGKSSPIGLREQWKLFYEYFHEQYLTYLSNLP
jgi:hypothetical protein